MLQSLTTVEVRWKGIAQDLFPGKSFIVCIVGEIHLIQWTTYVRSQSWAWTWKTGPFLGQGPSPSLPWVMWQTVFRTRIHPCNLRAVPIGFSLIIRRKYSVRASRTKVSVLVFTTRLRNNNFETVGGLPFNVFRTSEAIELALLAFVFAVVNFLRFLETYSLSRMTLIHNVLSLLFPCLPLSSKIVSPGFWLPLCPSSVCLSVLQRRYQLIVQSHLKQTSNLKSWGLSIFCQDFGSCLYSIIKIPRVAEL